MAHPGRNYFTNPANSVDYVWTVNHDEEQEFGKSRNIDRTGRSGNTGLVRQQGDDGPLIMTLSGRIVHRAQYVMMWQIFELCRTQTVYFTDFDGQSFEVLVTEFRPLRRRGKTSKDPSTPRHFWEYTMTLDIIRVISGDLVTAGVTP